MRPQKERITANNLRISMHPGQYTLLNALDMDIVERTIADLNYYVTIIELLGGTQANKIVIHIGGIYGDKEAAIERFIDQANQLSDRIKDI
ncbi:hypothetical protein [Aerococcus urinaeequi]|uniref:hypothetical protein n=2 Tax=Aerococcus TaxID=1375 RepID=UPI002280ADB2|nr:hypothetical protein [Aerococcus urinaeequi]